MAEPTSTTTITAGVLTFLAGLMGPLLGNMAMIIICAAVGTLWPLAEAKTKTRMEGFWMMVRCALTALVLTNVLATLVESRWGFQAGDSMGAVALGIGMLGNSWQALIQSAVAIIRRASGGQPTEGSKP